MSTIDNLFLGSVPATGPRALVMKVTIAPPALTEVDLRQKMDLSLFVGCQAVYVDASKVTDDITMTTSMGQKMTFKKGTQGYYPILEGVAMKFLFTSETFQQLDIIFLNQPIAVGVWGGGGGGGDYELPTASATNLGGVKVGNNLTIDEEGFLSATGGGGGGDYELPTASATNLGGVKVGNNLTIDEEGFLSATGGGGGGSISISDICEFFIDESGAEVSSTSSWVTSIEVDDSDVVIELEQGLYQFLIEVGIGSPSDSVLVSAFKIMGTGYAAFSETFAIAIGEDFTELSPSLIIPSDTSLNGRISIPASMTYIGGTIVKIA